MLRVLLLCVPSSVTPLRFQDAYQLGGRIDFDQIAGMDGLEGIGIPPLGDGHPGKDRALHHHWVQSAKDKRLEAEPFVRNVCKGPTCGDTALGCGNDHDLVSHGMPFEGVTDF